MTLAGKKQKGPNKSESDKNDIIQFNVFVRVTFIFDVIFLSLFFLFLIFVESLYVLVHFSVEHYKERKQ